MRASREPSAIRDGGYQGSADPGEPTALLQPLRRRLEIAEEALRKVAAEFVGPPDERRTYVGAADACCRRIDQTVTPALEEIDSESQADIVVSEVVRAYPMRMYPTVMLSMPAGARVLGVSIVNGQPVLLAEVDLDRPTERRFFHVAGTDKSLPDARHRVPYGASLHSNSPAYVGTVVLPDNRLTGISGDAFHVYELTESW